MSKKVLTPVKIATAQDLSGNFVTSPTNIQFFDRVSIAIDVASGSTAVGTCILQGRTSYSTTGSLPQQGPATEWCNLSGTSASLPAASGSQVWDVGLTGLSEIRLSYTSSSGSGTADIWISAKEAG